jgi:hypothetical protein
MANARKSRSHVRWATGLLTLGLLMGVSVKRADADLVAATYAGGGFSNNFDRATGYFFTPNQNLTVTELGYFDFTGTGLASEHNVGIFVASTATAVATALVSAGTVDPLIDGSRFVPITAVTLTAGVQYYAEADNNQVDKFVFGTGAVIYDPALTWNGFGDSNSNSIFGTVTNLGGLPGNLGPNFIFQSAAVPEPSSLAVCLFCAVSGLGYAVSRRRRG